MANDFTKFLKGGTATVENDFTQFLKPDNEFTQFTEKPPQSPQIDFGPTDPLSDEEFQQTEAVLPGLARFKQLADAGDIKFTEPGGFETAEPVTLTEEEKKFEAEATAEIGRFFADEVENSLKRGSLNVLAGLGGTLEEFARLADKPGLNQVGAVAGIIAKAAREKIKDPKLTPSKIKTASGDRRISLFVAQAVFEALPFMAGVTVATVLGGPVAGASVAFAVEGESAFQEAIERGDTPDQANIDRLIVGTINAALEQLQVNRILKFGKGGQKILAEAAKKKALAKIVTIGKKITIESIKQFTTEALQEATQEAVSIAAPAIRRGDDVDIGKAAEQIGKAGLGGGVAGLILGGGSVASTAITSEISESLAEEPIIEEPVKPTPEPSPAAPVAKPPTEVAKPKPKVTPEKVEIRPPEQTTTESTPKIQQKVTETVETDFTEATAAKQASLAEDRESMGLNEINSPDRKSWEESLRQAKTEKIASKANRIAEEVNANPRPLNDVETAGVTIRMAELKNEHKEAMEAVAKSKDDADIKTKSAEVERIELEFDALTKAVQISGTEKGRALAAQKLTINKSFDLISVLNRAKSAAGKKLTAVQNKIFKGLTEKLSNMTKRVELLESEVEILKANTQIKRGNKRFTTMKRTQRQTTITSLAADVNALLKQGCNN